MLRRFSLLSFALAALLALAPSTAHAQIGFAAGLNFDDAEGFGSAVTAEDDAVGATYDAATGYHVGIFFDMGLGPIAVRPGIYYRSIGKYETVGEVAGGGLEEESYDLSLIDVGLDLRYTLLPLPFVKPYLLGGPLFSFPQTDSETFDEVLSDVTVAANVGIGVSISPPGFGLRVMPELRYAFGVSGFLSDEEIETDFATFRPDGERLNSLQLRLNVMF